jgi:hypothetical protein
MGMARRHRLGPWHAGAVARRTTWARSQQTVSIATGTAFDNVDLLANFRADGGTTDGCTVARIHFRMNTTSAMTPGDAFGFGIFRGQNTDVGTSVVGAPNPTSDPYEDWLYWTVFGAQVSAGSGPGYFPGGAGAPYEIDVRAKRKIPQLQQTLIASWGLVTVTTSPLVVQFSASVLLMLP